MLKNSSCTYRSDYALTSLVADGAEKQEAGSKHEAGGGGHCIFCPPFIQKSAQTMKAACRGAAQPAKAAGAGRRGLGARQRVSPSFLMWPLQVQPQEPSLAVRDRPL